MFKVDQIDHVEFFVPDRREAARWYERTLGLIPVAAHEDWGEDPGGPLMISSNGGGTMLALFTGEPRRDRPTAGFHRVAFRVDGPGFLAFLEHVRTHPVHDDAGGEVTGRPSSPTPGLLLYVMVDSVAATVEAIIAHGGRIVQPLGADAPELTARFA